MQNELYHFGVKGMRWGYTNKLRKSIKNETSNYDKTLKKRILLDKAKKNAEKKEEERLANKQTNNNPLSKTRREHRKAAVNAINEANRRQLEYVAERYKTNDKYLSKTNRSQKRIDKTVLPKSAYLEMQRLLNENKYMSVNNARDKIYKEVIKDTATKMSIYGGLTVGKYATRYAIKKYWNSKVTKKSK